MSKKIKPNLPVIGWREWVVLPQLGVAAVKAKLDTGARSSSLHAFDVTPFERDAQRWVRFSVHPLQRNTRLTVHAEAPVLEYRNVKSSSNHTSRRPVILTQVRLGDKTWTIELTLADRDQMGFRMLLGRQAIRGRYLVDSGHSYLIGRSASSA